MCKLEDKRQERKSMNKTERKRTINIRALCITQRVGRGKKNDRRGDDEGKSIQSGNWVCLNGWMDGWMG
jgi:hypothetical protein